jgi:hypothetical protein
MLPLSVGRSVRAPFLGFLVVLLPASLATACVDRADEPPAFACGVDPDPPTWSYLSTTVFRPNCATALCHSSNAASAGVVLDDREDGFRSLLAAEPEPFVRPFEPQNSQLLYLLEGFEVTRRMPPDAPLPAAQVDLVTRWICAGAENN